MVVVFNIYITPLLLVAEKETSRKKLERFEKILREDDGLVVEVHKRIFMLF